MKFDPEIIYSTFRFTTRVLQSLIIIISTQSTVVVDIITCKNKVFTLMLLN